MRLSLSWLKEYIPLSLSASDISKILTMAGLEVEGIECFGERSQGVVVGRVLEVRKHPDADKLTIAQVFDGNETFQVVCGAPNCREGIKTAFARIGTKITDDQGEFVIKKAKLRGVESSGMLCAAKEIGLSEESDKIMELPESVVEGAALKDIYGDTFFEISLTPNLNYCASVVGVARELSALLDLPLNLPTISLQETKNKIADCLKVEVKDSLSCPRYACRVIKDVKIAESPDWLKTRLESAGIRSINNVVDVTNYVLLEMGHPLHAFDYDLIDNQHLIIRDAEEGETIETLDGKMRILKKGMLVICDAHKPLALAGVMGGANSEVTEQTKTIVLESAYFNPTSIRRTSKQNGLSTDASKRFERGADPKQVLFSLDRATQLIQQLAGGAVQEGVIDISSQDFSEKILHCRLNRINQILGLNLSGGEVEAIFSRLKFHFTWDGRNLFVVTVPTYRVDIHAEIDLIEEVARLYGYDNIPRVGGSFKASSTPCDPVYEFEKQIRSIIISEGLQEFLTCDLIGPAILDVVQDQSPLSKMMIKVLNPVSIEQSILRTSLLPGLLQVVKHNQVHQRHDISGFEIGRIHFKDGEKYIEQSMLGIILTGNITPHQWDQKAQDFDFYDLKGMVENLLSHLGISQAEYKNLRLKTLHDGCQASVFMGEVEVGTFGEIHPAIQRRLDSPQKIFFGEFNLHDLMQVMKPLEKVKALSIYPSSERDWTCTIKEEVMFEALEHKIESCRPVLLEKFSLKGIYKSEKLPLGYHNMTLNFIYRDWTKTISQEKVKQAHDQLIDQILGDFSKEIKNENFSKGSNSNENS